MESLHPPLLPVPDNIVAVSLFTPVCFYRTEVLPEPALTLFRSRSLDPFGSRKRTDAPAASPTWAYIHVRWVRWVALADIRLIGRTCFAAIYSRADKAVCGCLYIGRVWPYCHLNQTKSRRKRKQKYSFDARRLCSIAANEKSNRETRRFAVFMGK